MKIIMIFWTNISYKPFLCKFLRKKKLFQGKVVPFGGLYLLVYAPLSLKIVSAFYMWIICSYLSLRNNSKLFSYNLWFVNCFLHFRTIDLPIFFYCSWYQKDIFELQSIVCLQNWNKLLLYWDQLIMRSMHPVVLYFVLMKKL
jgi:hypothetical protein